MAAKQRRKVIGIDDGRYVDRIASIVQTCGEYDRLIQGCFEHYPNLKPLDASFANVCRQLEWVEYYDRLNGKISQTMEFELYPYLPYAVTAWYAHFAAPGNATRPAEWPRADYEAFQTRVANEEIAHSFMASEQPIMRSLFNATATLTELLPLLMRIISPPLKPVNANIVKPTEKARLARLVELMIPLGLRFCPEKNEDGQPMMRLEPAIDVFIHYEGKRAGDMPASRFAVRQLVAQAIDSELARRRGAAPPEGSGSTSSSAAHFAEQYQAARGAHAREQLDTESTAATVDFFGRAVSLPNSAQGMGAITEGSQASFIGADHAPGRERKKFRVVYKFNEGSSSAVRKNIKMSALI